MALLTRSQKWGLGFKGVFGITVLVVLGLVLRVGAGQSVMAFGKINGPLFLVARRCREEQKIKWIPGDSEESNMEECFKCSVGRERGVVRRAIRSCGINGQMLGKLEICQ